MGNIKHNEENEKKFKDLMAKYKNDEDSKFTIKELEFLGGYDLVRFGRKFPGVADFYMEICK